MEQDTSYAVIEQALRAFQNEVAAVREAQTASEQSIATAEYELAQLKLLMAEFARPAPVAIADQPSGFEIAGEDVGRWLRRRFLRAA